MSIKKLKKAFTVVRKINLLSDYEEVIETLKKTPYTQIRNFEQLRPKNKLMYFMRINGKHNIETFYNFYCLSLYKEESDVSDPILLSKSFVSGATIDYDKLYQ